MATSNRGGLSAPKGSVYDQPPPSLQPEAKPLGPTGKVTSTPNFRGAQRGSMPAFRQTTTHLPKGPSESDLIFQREKNAIGPAALQQASNPRVAALQQVLGDVSGIPSLTHAVRTHNVASAAAQAATFLPLGRVGRAIKAGADVTEDVVRAARTAEEAAQHVSETSAAAKAQGFGIKAAAAIHHVEPGEIHQPTGGELGQQVRDALKTAGPARSKQAAGYSAERGKRAAVANQAMTEIGGIEGHHAALSALKGELPKVHFAGFENIDSDAVLAMIKQAQEHPGLKTFEKIRTVEAITKAVNGKVPTASDQQLLERVFGKEVAASVQKASFWRDKVGRNLAEAVNLPRALEASFDLSAPFRQGLVAGVAHPVIFSKNLLPMVKAFGSDKAYSQIMEGIAERPTFPLMDKARLAITDVHGHALVDREEMFMSRLVGKVPALRGSERAYTGFLNKTRADIFDHLVQQFAEQGRDLNDVKLLKDTAKVVNTFTGRGSLGKMEKAAVLLNSTLFSPRLLASRLNMLYPPYYYRLDPAARQEALRGAAGLVLTMGTVLSLARMAGAKVNADPRNADFGKIRLGNTRIDIAAGFQQPIRLLAQEASGKIVSSTTGKTLTLGPSGPGHLSRWDIGERFLISKFAPVPSIGSDVLHGQTFIGQPVTLKGEASQRLTPLLWQDIYDLYKNGGVPAAAAGVIPGLFGVGLQTYKPKTPKSKTSYGSGDPYTQGSSYDQTPNGGSNDAYSQPATP